MGTTVYLLLCRAVQAYSDEGELVLDCLHFTVCLHSFQPTGMEIAQAQNVLDGTRMVYSNFPI